MHLKKRYGVLLVLLVVMGCSQKTPSEYIEEAEQAILKNENDTAVIVLKNALSSEPTNLRARFLLGSVYFKRGNADSAEKELKIALEGGYFKNEVLPLYLGTLDFLQRDDEIVQVVERATGLNSETEAAAQTYKGLALFRKNEVSRAKLAIKRASELAPDSPYSRLGRAHHALRDGEVTDAIIILDELLVDDPDFMEAVLMRGQLAMQEQDYEIAIKTFEKYVGQKPQDAQGNFLLTDALIRAEKYQEAETLLNSLLAKLPNNAKLNEFSGILKFNNNDYAGAKTAMEQSISNGSNSATVRLIAGVASYQENKLEQAHKHLASVQGILPENHPAKRLFAEIQLRLGYSTEAAVTLGNLGNYDLSDVSLFTQAGLDLVKRGDQSNAQKMLDLAKDLDPQSAEEKTRVGTLKLSLNDLSGISDLDEAIELDPKTIRARLVLAQFYIGSNEFDKAIATAKQWVEVAPEEVTAYNLLAEVYELSGNTDLAQQTHEKVLLLSPNNPASLKFMADLAMQDGNNDNALTMLKQAAENNPEYVQGTFDYLMAAKDAGEAEAEEALALMKSVSEADPDNVLKSLNYARGLVVLRQPQLALDILSKITADVDMPMFYWKGQADSLIALNKPNEAVNVYTSWQQLEPQRKEPWLLAIVIYDRLRDMTAALDTVKRALNHHQDDDEFKVMELHYTLLSGNISVAKRLYNNLPVNIQQNNIVKGMRGQLHFAENEFRKALPLLQAHYDESRDGRIALTIADAKAKLNEADSGLKFLEDHLVTVPGDLNVRARLAERIMEASPEKAIIHYEYILQFLPENIIALNNLGWLYGKTGDAQKAVEFAEKAVALRPENPKLLDTLGVALLSNGEKQRALEVSKKAFDIEPSNQVYRVHYEEAQKANQ
ncbi:XrtA/PEP-CTERM system TPR-repeat protein PrsT [Aliiglaciecola sp. M165]|uniref:XrtA/PEP-CTERM system TPR-repeat protein PrsT n=1 Tax=Aliiglaciecola sp. M165 TaxID=2593649 RepID=UPI00163DCB72|nr:XrtA/PEP-CTERM system TPR-repeat protein PrsT [Aliiglaciecola sp. M165]